MSTNRTATSNTSRRTSASALPAGVLPRVVAGSLALAGFTVAVLGGLVAGNPGTLVLTRAIIAMVLCYPTGFVIGLVCERVIRQHLEAYAAQRPLPTEDSQTERAGPTTEQDEEEVIVV